jgi:hypothetical protein
LLIFNNKKNQPPRSGEIFLLKNKEEKMDVKKEETKKCITCGRPATRELLILDIIPGGSTVPICDSYPYCGHILGSLKKEALKKEEKEK